MNRYSKFSLLALALAAAASMAYAAQSGIVSDALGMSKAKITLTQAIATAEQHANGKALEAEYEHAISGAFYEVDVVSAGKVFEVKVDADKGSVLSSVEEKKEHDDEEHDQKD